MTPTFVNTLTTGRLYPAGTVPPGIARIQRALLWAAGCGGAIVMIEPSPYEIATLAALRDKGFQIDLIFQRADRVFTVCEIKYQSKPVTTTVIPEMEKKLEHLTKLKFYKKSGYTLEKALISLYGPDPALKDSEYFHHSVTLAEIIKK